MIFSAAPTLILILSVRFLVRNIADDRKVYCAHTCGILRTIVKNIPYDKTKRIKLKRVVRNRKPEK